MQTYILHVREFLLNGANSDRLFVSKEGGSEKHGGMSHSGVYHALTGSFQASNVFGDDDYQFVSCRRIRIACATHGARVAVIMNFLPTQNCPQYNISNLLSALRNNINQGFLF